MYYQFSSKMKDTIRNIAIKLSSCYNARECNSIARYIVEEISGLSFTDILVKDTKFSEVERENIEVITNRLLNGEPLQYILGYSYFCSLKIYVNNNVLIPRPETELLCRMALDVAAERQIDILDLCTGSGCIAWTVALECPQAEVTAVDISDGALDVAVNQDFTDELSRTGAKAPVFCKADVLAGPEAFCRADRKYDLILSNPPYVMDKEKALMRTNVLEHEPHLALFVSDDDPLVFYRAVAAWASALLAPDGTGIVEINEALGPETAKVFLDAGFSSAEIVKDLSERDRFVVFSR